MSAALVLATATPAWALGNYYASLSARVVTPTGISSAQTASGEYSPHAPFNIIEPFSIGSRGFVFLLSSATGLGVIAEIDAQGTLTHRSELDFGNEGWRAAQVWRASNQTRVHVYNPRVGRTRRYAITDDGVFQPGTRVDNQFDDLKDKHIVSGYRRGSQRRAFALDPFSGRVAVHAVNPQSVPTTASFSLGWSDVSHLRVGGTTYRLLYKEVGNPFTETADSAGAGRLVVSEVGGDGLAASTALDIDIGAGWTSVGLVELAGEAAFYAYRRHTGELEVHQTFGPGLSGPRFVHRRTIDPELDRVVPVERGSQVFMVGANFAWSVPAIETLDGEPAARFAACIDKKIGDRVPGYQLALLQNGNYLLDRAEGFRRLSSTPVKLQRDDRINVGSVGKMFTTVTAFRAHDAGAIDIDAPIAAQLQPSFTPAPWTTRRTPRDLLAQTSGWDRDDVDGVKCVGDDVTLTVDCSAPFTSAPPNACGSSNDLANRQFACDYGYFNANFGMLRQVIQQPYFNITTTPAFEALTKNLWLDAVLPNGPSCQPDPAVKRFGYCTAGHTCYDAAGVDYREVEPDPWNVSCAAGGWTVSAHDLARMVEQLRAEQVLSSQSTYDLFEPSWRDQQGGAVGHGWDNPYQLYSGGDAGLGKGGSTSWEKSYVSTLGRHTSVALTLNASHGALRPEDLVKDAYLYAIGQTSACRAADLAVVVDDDHGGAASEVATTYVPVEQAYLVALRNSQGDLQIKSYSVASDGSVSLLAQYFGEPASNISIAYASSGYFMVGFENAAGDFRIQLFRRSGAQIHKFDSYTAGAVRAVKLVHLAQVGAEVAAVLKTGASKLKVIVFDRNGASILRKADYESSGRVQGVDAASAPNSRRIVTAVRTNAGRQRLIVFDTNYAGSSLTRISRSRDADERAGRQSRITYVPTDGGAMFVTSTLTTTDWLHVDAWTVASGGTVTRRGFYPIPNVASAGAGLASDKDHHAFIPFVAADGRAVIAPLEVSESGGLVAQPQFEATDEDGDPVETASKHHVATTFSGGRRSVLQVFVDDGDYGLNAWAYHDYE